MDEGAARQIIREQNQAAPELARKALEQLRPVVAARGRKAEELKATLAPWTGRALRFMGGTKPEARRALVDASQWVVTHWATPAHMGFDVEIADDSKRITIGESFLHARWKIISDPELLKIREFDNQEQFDSHVRKALDYLDIISKRCRQEFRVRTLVLHVPGQVHPPRHARVREGVLARLLAEDIAEQVVVGETLEASSTIGVLAVEDWASEAGSLLSGLGGVRGGLDELLSGLHSCRSPLVPDPGAVSRAYLSLGLHYLKEVQERMPDYAEASGQEPRVSMNISGNTIYGGQFAAQIANIDSTIAGVVQQGSHEVADALKALEQAVLSQRGVDEEQRRDLLDNVGYLAEAAQTPSEQRNRGILRSALSALNIAATSGSDLRHALDSWAAVLNGLLP